MKTKLVREEAIRKLSILAQGARKRDQGLAGVYDRLLEFFYACSTEEGPLAEALVERYAQRLLAHIPTSEA